MLPDVNVWLALAWDGHRQHGQARRWFEEQAGSVFFCRVSQMGLLRLLTQPALMGEDVLSQQSAWKVYEALSGDERCAFRLEPPTLEQAWKGLSSRNQSAHRRWTDDYLAAFASESNLELVTFDKSLTMPSDGRLTVLS